MKEISNLQLFVKECDLNFEKDKLKEIIKRVAKHYGIDLERNQFIVEINKYAKENICLNVKIICFDVGLPIVAALELFIQLLGNIKIYKKIIEYRHECR